MKFSSDIFSFIASISGVTSFGLLLIAHEPDNTLLSPYGPIRATFLSFESGNTPLFSSNTIDSPEIFLASLRFSGDKITSFSLSIFAPLYGFSNNPSLFLRFKIRHTASSISSSLITPSLTKPSS